MTRFALAGLVAGVLLGQGAAWSRCQPEEACLHAGRVLSCRPIVASDVPEGDPWEELSW